MASVIKMLSEKGLIKPPSFCKETQLESLCGSVSYGVSSDTSDMDIYSFCVPPKEIVFPHLAGEIPGFGKPFPRFEQFQQHHIKDITARKEYDIVVYNIVKYFQLCAEGNPNVLDSIFVPRNCVLHLTEVGDYVRSNRKLFLSKKCFYTYKGYGFSQLEKCEGKKHEGFKELLEFEEKNNINHKYRFRLLVLELKHRGLLTESIEEMDSLIDKVSKYDFEYNGDTPKLTKLKWIKYYKLYSYALTKSVRCELIKYHGFDTKFAYHIVRLIDEVRQILTEGDIDLQRSREHLKSIRRGEVPFAEIQTWFYEQEKALESLCDQSKVVPQLVRWTELNQVLINALEMYYGNLEKCVANLKKSDLVLKEITEVLKKNGY